CGTRDAGRGEANVTLSWRFWRRDRDEKARAPRPSSRVPQSASRAPLLAAHRPDTAPPTRGVPPEILRQVKLIELRTLGRVNSLFTGEYRSVFKGQGMEFAEVREYQAGDEVR